MFPLRRPNDSTYYQMTTLKESLRKTKTDKTTLQYGLLEIHDILQIENRKDLADLTRCPPKFNFLKDQQFILPCALRSYSPLEMHLWIMHPNFLARPFADLRLLLSSPPFYRACIPSAKISLV